MEPPHFRSRFFWGVHDPAGFNAGIDAMVEGARVKAGWFAGDNLVAFGRNLGFLNDPPFRKAWDAQIPFEEHPEPGPATGGPMSSPVTSLRPGTLGYVLGADGARLDFAEQVRQLLHLAADLVEAVRHGAGDETSGRGPRH